jgi:hypothetical protein
MKRLLFLFSLLLLSFSTNAQMFLSQPGWVKASGMTALTSFEFNRPSNYTAYAIGDLVMTVATNEIYFTNSARVNGGSGYITGASVMTQNPTNSAVAFRLWLFTGWPGSAVGDNIQFPLNRTRSAIGYLDITTIGAGSTATAVYGQNIVDRLPFVCDSTTNAIWGLLEARTAFGPTTNQEFRLTLTIEQN